MDSLELKTLSACPVLATAFTGIIRGPKTTQDDIDLSIPPEYRLNGAKLSTLTQKLAYKGLLQRQVSGARRRTTAHLEITRHAVKDAWKYTPTDGTIWKSLRSKEFSRNIRDFLWKCIHQTYKCGSYWDNIPQYEHRAICPTCESVESLEHILTDCDAPGRKTVWQLCQNLWLRKHDQWEEPSLGLILGCGLAAIQSREDKRRTGATRLYKILMSESAHLIWKIRCERRISREDDPERQHSTRETTERWYKAINGRLHLDKVLTRKRFRKLALPRDLVLETWGGILHDEDNLPDDWCNTQGVLVGRGPPERDTRPPRVLRRERVQSPTLPPDPGGGRA